MNQPSHGRTGLPFTMPPPPAPQPESEKPKAASAADFKHIVEVLAAQAVRRLSAAGVQGEPVLSFDNASIHTSYARAGPMPRGVTRHVLPARSPDLHKVVEHTFGRLKPCVAEDVFDACAAANTAELSPSAVRGIVERSLREVAKADIISKDCESLKTTLRIVARAKGEAFMVGSTVLSGTGGDWAPRRWR